MDHLFISTEQYQIFYFKLTTGIILTVRLESTRLKRKAFLKLNNITILEQIILRLKSITKTKKIVLCTSKKKNNYILKKIAKKYKVNIFFGDDLDVLKRIYDAAKKFDFENILCCTGDNALVDLDSIKKIVKIQEQKKYDFIKMKNLPWGTFSYLVKRDSLSKIIKLKQTNDTEVWYDYFLKNKDSHNFIFYNKNRLINNEKLRFTVDYIKDYYLLNLIYLILQKNKSPIDLVDAVSLVSRYKLLKNINKNIKQKKYKKIIINKSYKNIYK